MFVSSHLMSEMALTADHLIVIGRGRLLADMTHGRVRRGRLDASVGVSAPAGGRAARPLAGPDGERQQRRAPALLEVTGLTAAQIGEPRPTARHRAARADARAGLARGGLHGHDRRRVEYHGSTSTGLPAETDPKDAA